MPPYSRQITTTQAFDLDYSSQSVEGLLARSRQRSFELHRLDPDAMQARVLSADALRAHQEPLEAMLSVARSGMQGLYQQIRDVGYVVLLTDAQGVAVDFISNPIIEREALRAGLTQGGCWTEDQEGTCAVGLALVDRTAITVHHHEHFRTSNRNLTCSASPIFAGDGSLLAVLDASAMQSPDDRRSQHLVLKMVEATSRLIGDAYFLHQYQSQLVLRTSSRRDFLEIRPDGLLAFDDGGYVVGVNQQFQISSGHGRNSVQGMHISELFGIGYDTLLAAVGKAPPEPIRLRLNRSGKSCFALARMPVRAPLTRSSDESKNVALARLDVRMQANINKALRVLERSIPVLIQGETGTGKESFARSLHASGVRADGPFVVLSCQAFSVVSMQGEPAAERIAQAQGGTLFLDEIGDMSLPAQSYLLRLLAERDGEFDFQLVCATHHDIFKLVESGQFRADLYYRLNGMTLAMPALRERTDLTALIGAVLREERSSALVDSADLSAAARKLLLDYSWPGNIRQLRNVLRSALAICDNGLIEPTHLPDEIGRPTLHASPASTELFEFRGSAKPIFSTGWSMVQSICSDAPPVSEKSALMQALKEHNWNITAVARSLNVHRATIYRRMASYKLVPSDKLG